MFNIHSAKNLNTVWCLPTISKKVIECHYWLSTVPSRKKSDISGYKLRMLLVWKPLKLGNEVLLERYDVSFKKETKQFFSKREFS